MSNDHGASAPIRAPHLKPPWKPGQSGNPRGRVPGSRNKVGEAFLADLYEDYLEGGKAAIAAVRLTEPLGYLKIIASLLPKDVHLSSSLDIDGMSEDEVIELLNALRAERARIAEAKAKLKALTVDVKPN